MAMIDEIWGWISFDQHGIPDPVGGEILHEGKGLARRLGIPLVAITPEAMEGSHEKRINQWGADSIRKITGNFTHHTIYDEKKNLLEELTRIGTPRVFLFPHNANGRLIASLWTATTKSTLITTLNGLTHDGQQFIGSRTSHGNQFDSLVKLPDSTTVVGTLLPGTVGFLETATLPGNSKMVSSKMPADLSGHQMADLIPPDRTTLELKEAEKIVAFGRGAFSREAIALVETLAELLGATVAGTRPAADEGWLPFSKQVGLTGEIVSPKLYIAIGISGAPYHVVGIKSPETLIAINNDAEAPIHGIADLSIIGDLNEVLPEMISRLRTGEMPQAKSGVHSAEEAADG